MIHDKYKCEFSKRNLKSLKIMWLLIFLSSKKKKFYKVTEDHDLIFNDESKFGIFQCSEVLNGSFNYTRAPKQMVIKEDCVIRIGAFNSLFRFFF